MAWWPAPQMAPKQVVPELTGQSHQAEVHSLCFGQWGRQTQAPVGLARPGQACTTAIARQPRLLPDHQARHGG